jgi:hypothetical protein
MTADPLSRAAALAPVLVPRLLAFYRDAWDDDGTAIGWQTIAWGLVFADGSAISVPVDPPMSVTLWHSVDDALAALDAYVDHPEPRRTIDDGPNVQQLPRLPTESSPAPVDGAAARTACPDDPTADGRDRPLGPRLEESARTSPEDATDATDGP